MSELESLLEEKQKAPRFPKTKQSEFHDELKARVENHFERFGLSPKGDTLLFIKDLSIATLYLGAYILILSDHFGFPGLILLFAILGFTKGLIGFNIVHDALHGALTKYPRLNRFFGYWFDLNGTSSAIWKITHNQKHHTYTNIPGYDEDINKAIWLRLEPTDKLLPIYKYQCYYAFFLYSLLCFNWIFWSDYTCFFEEWRKGKLSNKDLGIFFALKLANVILFLGLPLLLLTPPWWQILIGYACMIIAGSLTVAIIFQLGHVVEGVEYEKPQEGGRMEFDWVMHEMKTTSNFATNNRLLSALIGGLNFQLEHHLFPYISHIHYADISKILKDLCAERGVPYNEHPSLSAAVRSHFRALKKLGTEVDCYKL
jgi:linoleoyl-CoA desaturase